MWFPGVAQEVVLRRWSDCRPSLCGDGQIGLSGHGRGIVARQSLHAKFSYVAGADAVLGLGLLFSGSITH